MLDDEALAAFLSSRESVLVPGDVVFLQLKHNKRKQFYRPAGAPARHDGPCGGGDCGGSGGSSGGSGGGSGGGGSSGIGGGGGGGRIAPGVQVAAVADARYTPVTDRAIHSSASLKTSDASIAWVTRGRSENVTLLPPS